MNYLGGDWENIGNGLDLDSTAQGGSDLWLLIYMCLFKMGILRITAYFSLSLVIKVGIEISK